MINNTKKTCGIILIIIVLAIIVIIPSYSNQDSNNPLILINEILRTNSIIENNTTETGLHLIEDNYYFIGIPMNNYVSINGELWRIVKISEDNSVLKIKHINIIRNIITKILMIVI